MVAMVDGIADKLGRKRKNQLKQDWVNWVQQASALPGLGKVHKATKERAEAPRDDAMNAAEEARDFRREVWQRGPENREAAIAAATAEDDNLHDIVVEVSQVRKAAGAIRNRAGLGRDRVDPLLVKEVCDDGALELASLYSRVTRHGVPPDEWMAPRVTMLPKPVGGFRPIFLLSMLYRIYVRLWKSSWQSGTRPPQTRTITRCQRRASSGD